MEHQTCNNISSYGPNRHDTDGPTKNYLGENPEFSDPEFTRLVVATNELIHATLSYPQGPWTTQFACGTHSKPLMTLRQTISQRPPATSIYRRIPRSCCLGPTWPSQRQSFTCTSLGEIYSWPPEPTTHDQNFFYKTTNQIFDWRGRKNRTSDKLITIVQIKALTSRSDINFGFCGLKRKLMLTNRHA